MGRRWQDPTRDSDDAAPVPKIDLFSLVDRKWDWHTEYNWAYIYIRTYVRTYRNEGDKYELKTTYFSVYLIRGLLDGPVPAGC